MPTLTELLDRLLTHYEADRRNGGEETVDQTGDLQPGLTDAEIDSLTVSHPYPLPPEVRELYRWHNGQYADGPFYPLSVLYPSYWFTPLEGALTEWAIRSDGEDNPEWWHSAWFPILKDDAYYYAVSCVADGDGLYPVIKGYEDAPPIKFAPSLTHLLGAIEEAYRLNGVTRPAKEILEKHGCGGDLFPSLIPRPDPDGLDSLTPHILHFDDGAKFAIREEAFLNALPWLNMLADSLRVPRLYSFAGPGPADFERYRTVLGPNFPVPVEKWWTPSEGLAVVQPMLEYARNHPMSAVGVPGVVRALTQMEALLTEARSRGLHWHLR